MDHETAAPLVVELAAGRTAGPQEAELRAHVETCPECARVHETAVRLGAQVREHGEALFTPHPEPDELAAYALASAELPTPQLAQIGRHVQACPSCGAEVSEARAAHREPAWRAWLAEREFDVMWRRLATALAAAVALLLVPAYLGVFELPRALRARRPAAAVEPRTAPATRPALEGVIASVLLTSGTRGPEAARPTVRLEPDAGAIALLVAIEPTAFPASGAVRATLEDAQGTVAWQSTFEAASAWDPGRHVVTLIVPASRLRGGDWTLRLAYAGAAPAAFEARFRVTLAPGSPKP